MTRHDSIGTPIAERLKPFRNYKLLDHLPTAQGRLTRMVGLTLEAVGLNVPVGSQCRVVLPHNKNIDAEVVGFNGDKTYLMPVQKVEGLQ